ncbi:MAG: aldo/keto reductase [Chloroflexi bacterium]|nr:aldo/keto reductase [Chloroflexota bacterium]
MQYRRLGRAGVKVSAISFGNWLTHGGYVEEQTAITCVEYAYDRGINLFDTANAYRRGAAEEVLRRALSAYRRESYVLATKVYFPMGEGPNDRGLSRKHIMEQAHASLRRLGVDYIDLYQCHRYDPETPLDETLRALDDLMTQGKILYAGVSEWGAEQLSDAVIFAREHNIDQIVSNQPRYNILQRQIERNVLPVCEREGIGLVVYSPLAQGVLTGKYRPGQPPPPDTRAGTVGEPSEFIGDLMQDDVLSAVQRLRPIADRLGITMSQLALAWVLRLESVSSAIIGASRPDQIYENVIAVDVELDEATLQDIDAAVEPVVQR